MQYPHIPLLFALFLISFPSCDLFRGPVDGGPCSYAPFEGVYRVAEAEKTEAGDWEVLFQSPNSPVPRVDYFFSTFDSARFDLQLLEDPSQRFRIEGTYITEGTCVPLEVSGVVVIK